MRLPISFQRLAICFTKKAMPTSLGIWRNGGRIGSFLSNQSEIIRRIVDMPKADGQPLMGLLCWKISRYINEKRFFRSGFFLQN